jgi:2-aminoethylphosphonate--pyruvate transaminase/phosphonoacetaldehyde hydrolase
MTKDAPDFGKVRGVILDWAGTAVDFGSLAPTEAFVRAAASLDLEISANEVRTFMGLAKRDHARALLGLQSVGDQWEKLYKVKPDEAAVDRLYGATEALLRVVAAERYEPVPGLLDFVRELKSAGIAVGSTTGYSQEVMERVVAASRNAGYSADCVVCPGPGLSGRPAPWLMFECARKLGIYPMSSIVKIGDTPADMEEARNAGAWAIGAAMSGNECGLDLPEYRSLDPAKAADMRRRAASDLAAAGAHFVVDGVWDCLPAIRRIGAFLDVGLTPSSFAGMVPDTVAVASGAGAGGDGGEGAAFAALAAMVPDNPYLLLTPGPLSTSKGVRASLLRDWCTWDRDYNDLVQRLRARLTALLGRSEEYSCVPMQGSGTFAVEAALTSLVPRAGRLLVLSNGAYGQRMAEAARRCGISVKTVDHGERVPTDPDELSAILAREPGITHVGAVHVETTTGILNPAARLAEVARNAGRVFMLDAMSSFGGMPMDVDSIPADVFISSANKCLQGIPGFAFVIARRELLAGAEGRSTSLSLDLHDQWKSFEEGKGKWRFTSPTHVVRALMRALDELDEEGGVAARNVRFSENRDVLVEEFAASGFAPLLPEALRSPIITSFLYPEDPAWAFEDFYARLKSRGFVLYPGKISEAKTFRVGTIGHVFPRDFRALGAATRSTLAGMGISMAGAGTEGERMAGS